MSGIVALGAEMQAATSLALAYPDRDVLFVSDQAVLDGWDLPNVRFRHATPASWHGPAAREDAVVALCPRWLRSEDWYLTRILPLAERAIGSSFVLPVRERPGADGLWHVKGDRRHRPDAPASGTAADLAEIVDTDGCGLVYQPHVRIEGTVAAIGRRDGSGTALGLFRVLDERFFRIAIFQAAETVADDRLAELSLTVLDALAHAGWFTLTWLLTGDGPRLASVRAVPRAVFGAFRRGGIDPLAPLRGCSVLPAGLRLVAQPHYSSYRRLEA
jgi:hypothetical protein